MRMGIVVVVDVNNNLLHDGSRVPPPPPGGRGYDQTHGLMKTEGVVLNIIVP